MKACIICANVLDLSEFYAHKAMADGRLNKCKSCCKEQAKARHHDKFKDDEWRELEKERGRDKYYRLYQGIKKSPGIQKKNMRKYRESYPEKYKAKIASQRLDKKKGNHLHHWSYNKEHYKDVELLESLLK